MPIGRLIFVALLLDSKWLYTLVYPFLFFFFPGVFFYSRVTGACPVTTDLTLQVIVITTTMTLVSGYMRWVVPGVYMCVQS